MHMQLVHWVRGSFSKKHASTPSLDKRLFVLPGRTNKRLTTLSVSLERTGRFRAR